MKLAGAFASGSPALSFEFFPPRTDRGYASLLRTVADLKRLDPAFVSVTWGAGGSTRRKTVELTIEIQQKIGITAMAHMTCVGSTRSQISETLDLLRDNGIENVLPLGGDQPEGYVRPEGGFDYANEMVEFIRSESRWNFSLAGACYPEAHPRANSADEDLANLVRKVDTGVDWLITQLFFDNRDYFAFVESARAAGITLPIVPGIMPVVSAANIRRITALCGARIPPALSQKLDESGGDDARTLEVGIEWATAQCRELLDHRVPGIHFYTLNRSPATRRIYESLFG
jgi:methylenetetrahydrofolate reductase (NADPH)